MSKSLQIADTPLVIRLHSLALAYGSDYGSALHNIYYQEITKGE